MGFPDPESALEKQPSIHVSGVGLCSFECRLHGFSFPLGCADSSVGIEGVKGLGFLAHRDG